MKRARPAKKNDLDPVDRRRDWILFSGYARMHVSVSGGPIHGRHKEVLQLFIEPWKGDPQSWTVYRHEGGVHNNGKIVFKKWDSEADRKRFRALGRKEAPKRWCGTTSVTENHIPVSGRWVKALERKVGLLLIPPIAGEVQPLSRDTSFRLRLWRNRQSSEFCWNPTPPVAWRPLTRFFFSLRRSFRRHADGKPLTPVRDL